MIIVVIIGNFILLNLFLAILIHNFSEAAEESKEEIKIKNIQKTNYKARNALK